jgi:phenylalanyl-tRNA synthetase alpha chain
MIWIGFGPNCSLEAARVATLGKKGKLTQLMKGLGALEPEARRQAGAAYNRLKDEIAQAIEARKEALGETALSARLAEERIDVSLPPQGRVHPISQTIDEVLMILGEMGFTVAEGPDIEDDFHNFTALNIPPEHPARQMMDTFYLPERPDGTRMVLRTHTSPVQIRAMQARPPPMTHTPMFHQVEGLVVDTSTHMGHLKGCLVDFCRAYFEVDDLPLRFRPSYFPFTEPSAEVDIGCSREGGELKIGAGDEWLEILGCGMVHPRVLEACGVDPAEYTRACSRPAASTPRSTRASPSASGWSGWRC